ncbi:TRAP transporter substrate-binding protein [Rhodobium gokarnense]|uniref:TRAP-type C4-dicarboxylate transport system substrate-binding protein n=1 Tax=Rhodobium gokarnense TaxID=364296 RepID=A0ABT3HGZ6_9HYPH|nr:TRAP transporter substrate-binding protein [Rhodobium gokarnense]MCW2309669.1 TRAP-type C4-dicarboxylate transport system substrate-binding protein [Rhodobium gokarnense]
MTFRTRITAGVALALCLAVLALPGAGTAAEPRITLRYAHCCPADQAFGIYAHDFADRVATLSNGEIAVEVLDGGVMGSEQATAQKVQLGVVQMAGITSNNVAQLAPSLNVLVLPYMTSSVDQLTGEGGLLRAGPYRDELAKRVLDESGSLKVVGGYTNSFRSLFAKDKCIDELADLQGLKIRAPKNPVMTAMWDAWGVSTYPIAWSETYGAVAQGVVDAFDSPTDVILKMGFYEHIKYITEATYLPMAGVVIANNDWLEGLDEADRTVILKAADEADKAHAAWVKKVGAEVRGALKDDHGVTFCELKDPEEWQSRARGAWPELYKLVGGGKDWVDATVTYLETGEVK